MNIAPHAPYLVAGFVLLVQLLAFWLFGWPAGDACGRHDFLSSHHSRIAMNSHSARIFYRLLEAPGKQRAPDATLVAAQSVICSWVGRSHSVPS
jgi:hypothetical protein